MRKYLWIALAVAVWLFLIALLWQSSGCSSATPC